MDKRIALVLMILLLSSSISAAEDHDNELAAVRQQAREERRKEDELSMMRLELEKLKLEAETRKTIQEIGKTSVGSGPVSSAVPYNIEVKSIVIASGRATAVVEAGGVRRTLSEGEAAGPFMIKKIDPADIIVVDEKGVETKAELHL
ncbi:MAG: hypothetical protein HQL22_01960 [Candidatus Omnitrophica bacterium]|nr:hypothetical protein [Candidatus Omnitrophota bacterium]